MTEKINHLAACLAMIVISVLGCQRTVQLDLNDAAPLLVIDADMSDVSGLNVKLSRSTSFYSDNVFPLVDSALITVEDLSSGLLDTVPQYASGKYYLRIKPQSGVSYRLSVSVHDSLYTAEASMPRVTHIDSVTFVRKDVFSESMIIAKVNFQDPAGEDDYYLFRQYLLKNQKWRLYPFSDRLSDGRYIQYNLRNDSAYIAEKDSIIVNLQCMDKQAYKYFTVVEGISADDNGFGSASPANPPTNISGGALGLFYVHSDNALKVEVPEYVPWED